jgi:hypothetical protein
MLLRATAFEVPNYEHSAAFAGLYTDKGGGQAAGKLYAIGQTTSHGFAVDLLATQLICLQHLETSRCCRQIRWWQNAVDLL